MFDVFSASIIVSSALVGYFLLDSDPSNCGGSDFVAIVFSPYPSFLTPFSMSFSKAIRVSFHRILCQAI